MIFQAAKRCRIYGVGASLVPFALCLVAMTTDFLNVDAVAADPTPPWVERQLTTAPYGHILTNAGVWSYDGQWIVFDVRSDPAGARFDGARIERVHVATGDVELLYQSKHDACCGVVTCSPTDDRVVFIHGPEHPTPDWQYAAYHRRGVIVPMESPGRFYNLDARDLTPPYTPGALRGGSHVHVFSGDGQWVSFTYEDHVLASQAEPSPSEMAAGATVAEPNQRNVGVAAPTGPVVVPRRHPRNHDGEFFSVLVTQTSPNPKPGSDEISRAEGDAWVGRAGYVRSDGSRQARAIAFLGDVTTAQGETISEVFIVDIPDNLNQAGVGPLQGTSLRRPAPPRGSVQRRLTRTSDRRHPGVQGPRHWVRSSPDGRHIAFLMRDDDGVVQIWTVAPTGGEPCQRTFGRHDVASAFSWSPDGCHLAYIADDNVWIADVGSGRSTRATARNSHGGAPRPEACVFSPAGDQIAYVRPVASDQGTFNQIFVIARNNARDND